MAKNKNNKEKPLDETKVEGEKTEKLQTENPVENNSESEETLAYAGLHTSLVRERSVLVVDEEGQRREETVLIVKKVLVNANIETADNPDQAHKKMDKTHYDTFVVNMLMPGYSSSRFVKAVSNHEANPLLVGFAADKMSDAYDPKKGIKVKPLRKLFELSDSFGTPNAEDEVGPTNDDGENDKDN